MTESLKEMRASDRQRCLYAFVHRTHWPCPAWLAGFKPLPELNPCWRFTRLGPGGPARGGGRMVQSLLFAATEWRLWGGKEGRGVGWGGEAAGMKALGNVARRTWQETPARSIDGGAVHTWLMSQRNGVRGGGGASRGEGAAEGGLCVNHGSTDLGPSRECVCVCV